MLSLLYTEFAASFICILLRIDERSFNYKDPLAKALLALILGAIESESLKFGFRKVTQLVSPHRPEAAMDKYSPEKARTFCRRLLCALAVKATIPHAREI